MTDKTFTIAGVSTRYGSTKERFANGTVDARTKILTRDEHTDIQLFALPNAMTKEEARAWLKENTPVSLPVATPETSEVPA